MNPAELLALAQRLLNHAAMHDSVVPHDDELRQWRDDLIAAAKYLRQCAEAEPVAWLYATIAGTRITHYADKLDVASLALDMKAAREYPNAHKVTPLYTHPQPQQADAERYRWLRSDSCPDHSARWTQWEVRRWKAPLWTGDLRRAELDAAIDAARGAG